MCCRPDVLDQECCVRADVVRPQRELLGSLGTIDMCRGVTPKLEPRGSTNSGGQPAGGYFSLVGRNGCQAASTPGIIRSLVLVVATILIFLRAADFHLSVDESKLERASVGLPQFESRAVAPH